MRTARSISGKNEASAAAMRGRRRVDDPGTRLAIGSHEAPGHVRAQPLTGGGQARERTGPDRLAHRSHHVTDPIVLELLRGRALLVNVVSVAFAESLIHLPTRHVDGVDGRVVQPPTMAGILEHGERLTAVVNEHPFASQLVPGERGIRRAAGEKESVLLVDLSEVHGRRPLAFLQGTESLRRRRLTDVYRAIHQPLDGRGAGRSDRVPLARALPPSGSRRQWWRSAANRRRKSA